MSTTSKGFPEELRVKAVSFRIRNATSGGWLDKTARIDQHRIGNTNKQPDAAKRFAKTIWQISYHPVTFVSSEKQIS